MSESSTAESARNPADELIVTAEPVIKVKDFPIIRECMQKMEKHLIRTDCVRSEFCEETGLELYLKKEFCQITDSCHARSALCTLLRLSAEQKKCGVVTALEEDALPLCRFGAQLGIPVEIVLQQTTLLSKIEALRRYKARLTIEGNNLDEAEKIASELATKKNMYCIKRNDKARYIGYGTIGIEIIEQVPNLDVVVVPDYEPLSTSIITVMKVLKPSVKVIIVSFKSSSSSFSETPSTLPTLGSVSYPKSSSSSNISKSPTVSSLEESTSISGSNPETETTVIQATTSEEELSSETESTSSNLNVSIHMDSSSGIEIPPPSASVRELIPPSASISESSGIEGSGFLPPSIHRTLSFKSESSSEARRAPSIASTPISSSNIELRSIKRIELPSSTNPTSSSSSVEALSSSKKLRLSSSTTEVLPSSISLASDEISLSTDSIPSRLETSCESVQLTSSSEQERKPLDVDVTKVVVTKEEMNTAVSKWFEKEHWPIDRSDVASFAACLRACTAGSLFDAYKNKTVVLLMANSTDDKIDLARLE